MDRKLPYRLNRIRMEWNSPPAADCSDLRNRQYRADLIIGIHHRYQTGIVPYRLLYLLRRNCSHGTDIQQLDLKPFFLQPFQGMQYGVMLKRCGQNVFFPLPRACSRR